jgi:hypothetical protein
MPGIKRLGLMILVLFGPGFIIYYLAKNVNNKFIELPYVGQHDYIYDDNGKVTDSILYTIPQFELTTLSGKKVTKNSIKDKFVVVTTLQNSCPDDCGVFLLHFEEIFYSRLFKNTDSYDNVIILSILTDHDGNPVYEASDKFIEEMKQIDGFDEDLWWITTGDPEPIYSFIYNDKSFYDLPSTPECDEVGTKAFINSLLLIDTDSHIRGFTGARSFSDISNFFDLLKILKKVEFDEERGVSY